MRNGAIPMSSRRAMAPGASLQCMVLRTWWPVSAASTAISLHTRDAPLQPQVQLDDVLKITPLFRSLDKFHRDGVFGMRADADNAYGFSPSYPMATRFVPGAILEAKWALVHGTAPAIGEEGE